MSLDPGYIFMDVIVKISGSEEGCYFKPDDQCLKPTVVLIPVKQYILNILYK